MDYQKMFESKLEELEKRVAGIEELYARRSEIPDLSPYLESEKAEENYATKAAFKRATEFLRRSINNARDRITKQREDLDKEIRSLNEKVKTKYGSDEVYTSIMYILKLYDKGELPGFNN
jgi:prefoldin subunit 5